MSAEDVQRIAAARAARPVHTFNTDTLSVQVRELSVDEELMAARRASGDMLRLQWELVQQSLVSLNGTPVNMGDGSAERVFGALSPKHRSMVMAAHGRVHNPDQDDAKGFLESHSIAVG